MQWIVILFKRFMALALLCTAAGLLGTVFNYVLLNIQDLFLNTSELIWLLPLAGMFWILISEKFLKAPHDGTHFLLTQLTPAKLIEPCGKLGPSIVLSTWWSHFFGASVGRESSALQLGGALGYWTLPLWSKNLESQKRWLSAAMAAGFSAVFHTPWAAAVFIYEISPTKSFRALLLSLIAAHGAFALSHSLYSHPPFSVQIFQGWSLLLLVKLSVLGVLMGLAGRLFLKTLSVSKDFSKRRLPNAYVRIFLGGVAFVTLWFYFSKPTLSGLSISLISEALQGQGAFSTSLQKALMTIVSIASGFKGGEVTPMFTIGAQLGSALGDLLQINPAMAAALGLITFFGAASGSLWACALMAAELFGTSYFIPALICLWWAHKSSTRQKLYSLS